MSQINESNWNFQESVEVGQIENSQSKPCTTFNGIKLVAQKLLEGSGQKELKL